MSAPPPGFASLLTESGSTLDATQAQKLLDVFLEVCGALGVSDPADARAPKIARELIGLALAGEKDSAALRAGTLAAFKPGA